MLFSPTALILATDAQRRHVAEVRLDGPVVDVSRRRRTLRLSRFSRSASTPAARGSLLAPRHA